MKTSVRDLLITGWAIILVVTVGVIAFHPSFADEGLSGVLRLGGLSLISTLAGIGLIRYCELLGHSSSRSKKTALGIFTVCLIPLVPVMYVTFIMPWAALVILTLLYTRWRWALVPSSQ